MLNIQMLSIRLTISSVLSFMLGQANAAEFWDKPIPSNSPEKSAATYHEVPIDFSDSRYREALLPLKKYGVDGEAFYSVKDGSNFPYNECICEGKRSLSSRKSVAEKLRAVNHELARHNLELHVFDAYRSVECQTALWKHFMKQAKKALGADASNDALVKYASNYCSNPTFFKKDDWHTWPTHSTGGAVDLTLKRKGRAELLYMGGVFDDDSIVSKTNFYELSEISDSNVPQANAAVITVPRSSISAEEAQRNRRILYWTMLKHGFSNYHNEWWHFDYGNQMWVQSSREQSKPKAFYGTI